MTIYNYYILWLRKVFIHVLPSIHKQTISNQNKENWIHK
uniref:Uncharacterized protein n=1 Tax=Arundo donax TaxID=35708 RepID=A0A0A9CDB8_ARUDO